MATYVLVHGGGHGGWCWARLAPLLRAAGHDVFTPTLTGVGERAHLLTREVGLDTHITDVANVLEYEDLRKVILVGHSYGGVVITGVADRVLERVGQLVYLDAAILANGESVAERSPGIRQLTQADARVDAGVELVLWPGPASRALYGITKDDDWAWVKERLLPHPWVCFEQRLTLLREAAVHALPRTIINCTATLARRPPEARERYLDAERVWEIDTGHDVMITAPAALADMLLRLATL